ncbi:hypothetical protein AB3480_32150 [Rhizobium mongolense]|uniref:hypothetical protein n=1 Tax=Rhizobium mongolense TaxID=57676 RepID=UPI0034A31695
MPVEAEIGVAFVKELQHSGILSSHTRSRPFAAIYLPISRIAVQQQADNLLRILKSCRSLGVEPAHRRLEREVAIVGGKILTAKAAW